MSWDNNNTAPTTTRTVNIKCNGRSYVCAENRGDVLINKIQDIRREQGFEKFDVFDASGLPITPTQVKTGEFTGDLTLIRFNKAA